MNGRASAKEAIRQVRREAGRLKAVRIALKEMQAALPVPSPEELAEMERGERPLSAEAYLLGVLQAATAELQDIEAVLRFAVGAKTLSGLERDWQRGALTYERELPWIRSALNARNA